MNVYVETNFVLEHALERQECESCEEILRLAAAGSIDLVIPAFSLAEPHDVLRDTDKRRGKLSQDLKLQLKELGRSRRYSQIPADFNVLIAILLGSGRVERESLKRTMEAIYRTAHIIPLDGNIIRLGLGHGDCLRFVAQGRDRTDLDCVASE